LSGPVPVSQRFYHCGDCNNYVCLACSNSCHLGHRIGQIKVRFLFAFVFLFILYFVVGWFAFAFFFLLTFRVALSIVIAISVHYQMGIARGSYAPTSQSMRLLCCVCCLFRFVRLFLPFLRSRSF
jgi:hypothetical protein